MTGRPLPRRTLKVLIAGVILVAWEPNVLIKGFPLGVALQLAGLVAALLAGWRLRDDLPPPWVGALGSLSSWGVLRGVSAAFPGVASYRALIDLLALAGFLLAAHALRERARARGQTLAFACWTHALIGGGVGFGLPIVAGLVTLALRGLGIETPAVLRHHPAAVILLALVVAAPMVLFARAIGWTLREESEAAHEGDPLLGRVVTHPGFALALFVLLLTPVWLLLPAWRHFASTPTFAAYLEQSGSGRRGATARTQVLSEGRVVQVPEEGAVPAGVFGVSHVIELELKHGDESLLWLEHELVITVDLKQGEIAGREAAVRGMGWDPRFSLVGKSRILKTPIRVGPTDAPTAIRVPFELLVDLTSKLAPARFEVRAVESVPPPTNDPAQAGMIANALGLPVERERPWLSIPGLLSLERPPSNEDGLRYAWQVRGWVELDPPRAGPDNARSNWQARVVDEVVFEPNTQAYSYAMESRSTLRTNSAGLKLTHSTKRRSARRLTWNGKVW